MRSGMGSCSPTALRDHVFDRLTVQTMRYGEATPTGAATGLTGQVYATVREEFFHQRLDYQPLGRSRADGRDMVSGNRARE